MQMLPETVTFELGAVHSLAVLLICCTFEDAEPCMPYRLQSLSRPE
jgi:hypothetical protein